MFPGGPLNPIACWDPLLLSTRHVCIRSRGLWGSQLNQFLQKEDPTPTGAQGSGTCWVPKGAMAHFVLQRAQWLWGQRAADS